MQTEGDSHSDKEIVREEESGIDIDTETESQSQIAVEVKHEMRKVRGREFPSL